MSRPDVEQRTTPAGAALTIRRGPRLVAITIDRHMIPAVTPDHLSSPEQAAMADKVADHAAGRSRSRRKREDINWGCGTTVWSLTAPREDEDAVLAALFAVEDGDYTAAHEYIGEGECRL